jgi:hypothetical protein
MERTSLAAAAKKGAKSILEATVARSLLRFSFFSASRCFLSSSTQFSNLVVSCLSLANVSGKRSAHSVMIWITL